MSTNITAGGSPGPESLAQERAAVESAQRALWALLDGDAIRTVHELERALWPLLLALGRAFVALFLARRLAAEAASEAALRGAPVAGWRKSILATRFGRVEYGRPFWRRNKRAAAEFAVDDRVGLGGGGFSLAVVAGVARLCAQMAFASVRREWRDIYGWAPSPRAVLRMVDAVGKRAEAFLETAPAPEDEGEVLVIETDGKGAPMISSAEYERRAKERPTRQSVSPPNRRERRRQKRVERARPRRTKGKKSKNAKVAMVGAIYTLKKQPDGTWDGPVNKRLIATFGSHDDLFRRLRREADKRGYGTKRTLFLADGAKAIWAAQQRYFPKAEVCIDWYHIVEKLWVAGKCFYREGSKQLAGWVAEQKRHLRHGRITAVLDELAARLSAIPRTGPGNKGKRERLEKVLKHLTRNRGRLRYRAFRREGFEIGSGVIEGAVRNLVGMRLDGPGMRWGRERSEHVLHLRCILLSDLWPAFNDALAGQLRPRLAAQPEVATPHDALPHAA